MRYKASLLLVVAVVALPTAALAGGPSGSKDSGQVKCKNGVATPVLTVYAGTNGAEVCSDDNLPPDGRIMVSTKGYVAADGDKSNPEQSSGFIRVDQSGPSCGGGSKTDGSKRGTSCQPDSPVPLPVP